MAEAAGVVRDAREQQAGQVGIQGHLPGREHRVNELGGAGGGGIDQGQVVALPLCGAMVIDDRLMASRGEHGGDVAGEAPAVAVEHHGQIEGPPHLCVGHAVPRPGEIPVAPADIGSHHHLGIGEALQGRGQRQASAEAVAIHILGPGEEDTSARAHQPDQRTGEVWHRATRHRNDLRGGKGGNVTGPGLPARSLVRLRLTAVLPSHHRAPRWTPWGAGDRLRPFMKPENYPW